MWKAGFGHLLEPLPGIERLFDSSIFGHSMGTTPVFNVKTTTRDLVFAEVKIAIDFWMTGWSLNCSLMA